MRIPNPTAIFPWLVPCLLPWALSAQPTIRVDKAYEDTVRILILSNDSARGNCNLTSGVGIKTRDFVLKSLTGVPNVKYRESKTTQWSDVQGMWPGKLPHVIVHVNAGWTTESGNYADGILNAAADSGIGVVSIGDDAAALAEKTFGMLSVDNSPQPMGDATQYRDSTTSLWLDLDGKADTVGGGGIVRNTTDSLRLNRIFFYPVEPNSGADPAKSYRCQEDADKYSIDPAYTNNVTFMGFQRAFDGKDTIAGPRELQTITAFQNKLRRGVALSYQPQFLANPQAAHQIDYDAIMYSSGANLYRNPSLSFTDSLGRDLGPGDVWSPAKGRLYLNFQDDFVRADLSKQITLTIANGSGAAGDVEAVTVGAPVRILGGKGRWRVEIALAEKPAASANGIVEVTLPSVITATAPSHGETGLADGGTVTAVLYLNSAIIPPRPPDIDTILSAWMLDLNGNGAADQARFRFTRPLNALPATISPIYWNEAGPKFTTKPPVLSFLAGSGQSIVVADFTGAEFPAGLTSIPAGARPSATFPSDTVFGGQSPQLADSMGAIPLSAVIALGASPAAAASGNGVVRIPDTLRVTLSEPLRPGYPSLLRFGKWTDGKCFDRGQSLPVAALGAAQASADAMTFVLVLDPLAAGPVSGDCAYLEGNGSVLDLPGNATAALGARITGPKPPMDIRSTAGYPPVSGGGSANPDAVAGLRWIPPVGFMPGGRFREAELPAPGQPAVGADPNGAEPLAPGTVLVKVVSAGKYLAQASLFDNLGNFVTSFGQSFGYKGELDNAARLEPQGYRSYLVWDGRDAKGRLAGQGVVIWKIDFILDDGARTTKTVRTGLLR
jgi:hypothetical protein